MAMKELGEVRTLCVHHSATHEGDVERFRREHRARGFEDVGYHSVILKDGTVEPGRDERFQGAGVFGANAGKLHVCLVGNFELEEPTGPQLDALGKWLLNRYHKHDPKAHRVGVAGHCEVALATHTTVCPGQWLRDRLPHVRSWVLARLAGASELGLAAWLQREDDRTPVVAPPGAGGGVTAGADVVPIRVRVDVKGYISEATKRRVEPAGLLIAGQTWVRLRDLAEGLDWDAPRVVEEDDGERAVVVATKRAVREARATLTGAAREEGGAE